MTKKQKRVKIERQPENPTEGNLRVAFCIEWKSPFTLMRFDILIRFNILIRLEDRKGSILIICLFMTFIDELV